MSTCKVSIGIIALLLSLSAQADIDRASVLELGTWLKEDLQSLIAPDNYPQHVEFMNEGLFKSVKNTVDSKLTIDYTESKQLASLYIAYVLVVIKPQRYLFSESITEALSQASDNPAWNAAAWSAKGVTTPGEEPFKQALKENVEAALKTLDCAEEDCLVVGDKLAELFVLAYLAQENYLHYMVDTYMRAHQALMADSKFVMTSDEVINFIANPTWKNANQEIAQHRAIIFLQNIMLNKAN